MDNHPKNKEHRRGKEDDEGAEKYLNVRMKSDKTGPQHRSKSSMIITTGLLQFPCSLYQVAKMEISGAYTQGALKIHVNCIILQEINA